MKTIIINGSPKGEGGNTHIFASHFIKGMGMSCEMRCIVKEDYRSLAEEIENFDSVVFIMPLYVHAMPGIVMKLLEHMKTLELGNRSMGFIIQSGFTEPAQSRFAKRYFEQVSNRLKYNYLGTVIKGGAAGTYLMPDNMNKKLFTALEELGSYYNKTGQFSEKVIGGFEKNYQMSKRAAMFQQFLNKTGLGNMFWNSMLKKHNAFDRRFDKPFSRTIKGS